VTNASLGCGHKSAWDGWKGTYVQGLKPENMVCLRDPQAKNDLKN